VQLETKHRASIVLPTSITASSPGPSAKKVLALITDQEGAYQESLGDVYHEMGETSFKGLRRALPLTRQKLDWDKVRPSQSLRKHRHVSDIIVVLQVLGYKLGAELSSSKAIFGVSGESS